MEEIIRRKRAMSKWRYFCEVVALFETIFARVFSRRIGAAIILIIPNGPDCIGMLCDAL